ncbi:MAG TPA: ABC transporter substrate-binding protein [Chloroflexota bacterium]|nr:ABC transporter substrate-binding protein [Chloroflexota bacterium]
MLAQSTLVVMVLIAVVGAGCAPAATPPPAAAPPAAGAQAAAPAAAAPTAVPPTAPATPPAPVTLRAGGLGGSVDRAYYVAEEKGYFAEQGITLDVENYRSASEMVPLLATGRMDVGHGSTNPGFFNAMLQGVIVKVVSDVTIIKAPKPGQRNAMQLMLRKDLTDEVRSAADLRGRVVGINNFSSLNHEQLEWALHTGSLELSDVQIEQVAFPEQLSALANGKLDAGITLEPFVTMAEARNVAVPLVDIGVAMPGHTAQNLFYSPELVQTQPDVGRRFIVAYIKALRYLEDAFEKGINREEAIDIFIKHTTLKDRALYDRMAQSNSELNGNVNVANIERDQDFYMRMGYQQQKADVQSFVDTSFGEYAVSVLGRYQE